MKHLIVLLAIAFAVNACSKKDDAFDYADVEVFSFGTAYGLCTGDCAKFYAISNGQLFPDQVTSYYAGPVSFSTTPLPDAKYQLAKTLLDEFPVYLLNHADTTFGCPDCADQGGIHIQLKQNGVLKTWHIDTYASNQPTEIKNYITKLWTVLGQL